ncbi:septal ring lytic transglycosylase RlpA family protein [Sphingorhabdus sp. Alg231-15]|uniref:septal ring lytic transglycosylase RlpA family protein n=1 Tax=Sphingorhabdus sp. Alg231-15 TaxID=1922222 RepID=UPI000D5582D6
MKFAVRLLSVSALAALLGSCGTIDGVNDNADASVPPAASGSASSAISDFPVKIGEPYKVRGKTYTPEDVASYDTVGYASWYGDELAGNSTANGERFNPNGISAAHKTLPLPSYVEVTALDTGRTILVRVNDRGPFANDRLIDLSHGAAKQLGIDQQGVAGVRVRKVNPNEQERVVLRNGGVATERIGTPDSLLTILRKNLAKLPTPDAVARRASTPAPTVVANKSGIGASYVPTSGAAPVKPGARDGKFIIEGTEQQAKTSKPTKKRTAKRASISKAQKTAGGYAVQVAAFGNKNRADALARKIGARVFSDGTGRIWRVRYGPYATDNEAKAGLAQARKRGYSEARILRTGK